MNLKYAMENLLSLLPECEAEADSLVCGAEYFDVTPQEVEKAAERLPAYHDLSYEGVRRLLSCCLEEFSDIFSSDKGQCEVSVPAPLCAVYALQNARRDLRFQSSAFFAEIVLRGIFLKHTPLDMNSCSKRRCGLNQMRRELLQRPRNDAPCYQLQFGVLCDECVKTGEAADVGTNTFSVCYPKPGFADESFLRSLSFDFFSRFCTATETEVKPQNIWNALNLYHRLLQAEDALLKENNRQGYRPLWGNSFTLAQSVQLMSASRPEKMIFALETLSRELSARKAERRAPDRGRIYCYYVPFLQPEIERRFRENGTDLMGNAAFLSTDSTSCISNALDIPELMTAWLKAMNIRQSAVTECAAIVKAIREAGCNRYLTGSFSFDRQLGAAVPLQRKLLEECGIQTLMLDADFWCENEMFGNITNRVDAFCN